MPNLNKARIAILAAIALMILGAIGVSAIGLVPQQELSSDQAVSAVKNFAKVNGIKRIEKDEFRGKRAVYEVVADDDRVFWVDAKTGKVTGVVGKLDEEPASSQELPLTKETAQKRAEAYLKGKYDRFEELTLTETEVAVDGNTIAFTWEQIDENGAKLPRWATLTVHLKTGELGGYASRDDETVISTKPNISKEEALSTAKAKLSSDTDDFTINSQQLAVMKDKNGQQRLVWIVSYTGYYNRSKDIDSGAVGEDNMAIDALTGDIVTNDFR